MFTYYIYIFIELPHIWKNIAKYIDMYSKCKALKNICLKNFAHSSGTHLVRSYLIGN